MAIPVALRGDFKASQLRGLARKTKDGPQARRLLAVAAIYDGATRTEAAKIGGVGLQIIRDWVMRFNARGAAGLLDGKSPGHPSKLNDEQRQAIVRMIESGPIAAIHGVVRWRLIDLSQWIYEEFRITVAKQTLSKDAANLSYGKVHFVAGVQVFGRECRRRLKCTRTSAPAAGRPSPRASPALARPPPARSDPYHPLAVGGGGGLVRSPGRPDRGDRGARPPGCGRRSWTLVFYRL